MKDNCPVRLAAELGGCIVAEILRLTCRQIAWTPRSVAP
jgi:hypothetical protein